MARKNTRGLELSFKPYRGSRGPGRWYKKFDGKAVYFGTGQGLSDKESYRGFRSGSLDAVGRGCETVPDRFWPPALLKSKAIT